MWLPDQIKSACVAVSLLVLSQVGIYEVSPCEDESCLPATVQISSQKRMVITHLPYQTVQNLGSQGFILVGSLLVCDPMLVNKCLLHLHMCAPSMFQVETPSVQHNLCAPPPLCVYPPKMECRKPNTIQDCLHVSLCMVM